MLHYLPLENIRARMKTKLDEIEVNTDGIEFQGHSYTFKMQVKTEGT